MFDVFHKQLQQALRDLAPVAQKPAEWSTPVRRGSTLVLVLGSLGLIAVLTVVYVSIGRADRRTSTATTERSQQRSSADVIIDNLIGPIADDAYATRIGSAEANGNLPSNASFLFEDTDYPSTAPGFFSVLPIPAGTNEDAAARELIERHGFNAQGSVTRSWWNPTLGNSAEENSFELLLQFVGTVTTGNPDIRLNSDFRTPSDPFLASTFPADIDGDAAYLLDDQNAILEQRDWPHISNTSPDGRFVNLYNMRSDADYSRPLPNGGFSPWQGSALSNAIGGFNAPSGFTVDGNAGFRHGLRGRDNQNNEVDLLGISDGLFWYADRTQTPAAPPAAGIPNEIPNAITRAFIPSTVYVSPGDHALNGNVPTFDLTARPALQTLPYLFDTNQRELFRPAVDLPSDIQRGLWADPAYWRYHFADADGDGFLDSRWQEMVDASNPRGVVDLAPSSGLRTFYAARVIDLSSLINVNTATDDFAAPFLEQNNTDGYQNGEPLARLGASPAEISARQVFTLEDVALDAQFLEQTVGIFPSYASLPQPIQVFGDNVNRPGDYSAFNVLGIGGRTGNAINPGNQYYLGRGALASIRQTIEQLDTPANSAGGNSEFELAYTGAGNVNRLTAGGLFTNFISTYEGAAAGVQTNAGGPIAEPFRRNIADRALDYNNLGGAYTPPGETSASSDASTLFNLDDLSELLTFWGANDDRVTTRLELAAQGRANVATNGNSPFAVSPLRSDRPTELELARGDFINQANGGNGNYDTIEAATDLFSSVFNSRRYLTTISGATPRVGLRELGEGEFISPADTVVTNDDTRRLLHTGDAAVIDPTGNSQLSEEQLLQNTFDLYADALMPTARNAAGNLNNNPSQSEMYAHDDPELALRLAAHMAVNFRDMADGDSEPTAAALPLGGAGGGANTLPVDTTFDNNLTTVAESRDVIVYGIERQPFITEAATFSAYADTPTRPNTLLGFSGDQDWTNRPDGEVLGLFEGVVTMDSAVDVNNPDFLFQVFVVQLSNPFDEEIVLESHHIEFANQVFNIPVDATIPPNESVWLYTTNPTRIYDDPTFGDPIQRMKTVEGRVFNALGLSNGIDNGGSLPQNQFNFNVWLRSQLLDLDNSLLSPTEIDERIIPLERVGYDFQANGGTPPGPGEFDPWYIVDPTDIAGGRGPNNPEADAKPRASGTTADGLNVPIFPTARSLFGNEANQAMQPLELGSFADLFAPTVSVGQDGDGEHSFVLLWNDSASEQFDDDILIDRLADPRFDTGTLAAAGEQRRPTLDTRPIFNPDLITPNGFDLRDPLFLVDEGDGGGQFQWILNSPTNGAITDLFTQTPNRFVEAQMLTPVANPDPDLQIAGGETVIFSTTFGRSIRRPNDYDPDYNQGGVERPVAAIPPWAIEAKRPVRSSNPSQESIPSLNVTSDLRGYIPQIGGGLVQFGNDPAPNAPMPVVYGVEDLDLELPNAQRFLQGYTEKPLPNDPLVTGARWVGALDAALIGTGPLGGSASLGELVFQHSSQGNRQLPLLPSLARDADTKTIRTAPGGFLTGDIDNDGNPDPDRWGMSIDRHLSPTAIGASGLTRDTFADRWLKVHTLVRDDTNDEFQQGLRVGDLLLPLGVGPFFRDIENDFQTENPGDLSRPQRLIRLRNQWTTLSEALALAYGYSPTTTPDLDQVTARDTVFDGLGGLTIDYQFDDQLTRANVGEPFLPLDNARLRLDQYTPYIGGGQRYNPTFTAGFVDTDPATGRPNQQLIAPGVPAALRLFALATAGGELQTDRYGNLTRPMTGLVNLNTAPKQVLRSLPLVTGPVAVEDPAISQYGRRRATGQRPAWSDWSDRLTGPYQLAPSFQNAGAEFRDASPSIFSYVTGIDSISRLFWPSGFAVGGAPGQVPGQPASSRTVSLRDDAADPATSDPLKSPFTGLVSRALSTAPALRPDPGIGSIGELLAAARNDGTFGPGSDGHGFTFGFLGSDTETNGVPRSLGSRSFGANNAPAGVVPFLTPGTGTNYTDDGIANDYDERLVELNAIANSASVRSDFYAMWLVIQGFRPVDVEGLEPSDPLVPAFRERYLVVVDRSNVTGPGDQPRILLRRRLDNGPLN